MGETHRHRPLEFLQEAKAEVQASDKNRSLIVLNQPITSLTLLRRTWENTSLRICADGGANRLHDFLAEARSSLQSQYVGHPACIGCGKPGQEA